MGSSLLARHFIRFPTREVRLMARRSPQTAAKRAREQAKRERRERREAKKAARNAPDSEGTA
jgi:hypothetical protein